MEENPLILPVVLGPTASGKSELALHIASRVGGEIVNCDSLQVYRGFDVGTAKLPENERRGIPHHLVDVVNPDQLFSAGDYGRVARSVLHEIAGRGRAPIVVGGTGFYLRALLDGLFAGPPRSVAIREKLQRREQRRPGSLHRILRRLDPESASRIHAHDKNKTLRALEVRLLKGQPISELFRTGRAGLLGFHAVKIGLSPPRELLYQRLDARTARIFEQGLVDEVRALLAAGVARDAKPLESIGYQQALQVVEGGFTPDQALESTQVETRHYAKRQITWFRKEPGVHWLNGFGDEPRIQHEALAIIELESSRQKVGQS